MSPIAHASNGHSPTRLSHRNLFRFPVASVLGPSESIEHIIPDRKQFPLQFPVIMDGAVSNIGHLSANN
jgi:hypothetical protein